MNLIVKVASPCFAAALVLMATAQTTKQVTPSNRPEATVRSLYREVQRLAPSGLPSDSDMRIFAPYLSESLRRTIGLAEACGNDWNRQNRGQMVKPPFAWSEFGLFSGANERTSPATFHIASIERVKDGSFWVAVEFTYRPGDGPGVWHVTDRVIQENGRFVLDDVLFPKDDSGESSTLTGILSEGCEGAHWVGEGGH
jgi:hypothetical protein